jgi:DNA-binding NarL/FixJ family response regulator
MMRNPAMMKTLCALFADSWGAAAPLRPVPMLDNPRQRDTARMILAALRDGHTDDVAARELGMSVRTYRRYVADFMRDVDATSRFQAGVRAAQLRLLPTD